MQLKVIEQYQEVIVLDQADETTTMVSAKRPPSLIQSFAGTSVLAYLTVSRFADHLPYYRLEDILGRSGFRIDRSTQWRWMRGLAHGVTPLVDLMWQRALQSQVVAMDETPVMELGGREDAQGLSVGRRGRRDHPYDCFFYTSDRRSIRPETFLAGFEGYLLADAYVAYERIGAALAGRLKASCWVARPPQVRGVPSSGADGTDPTALAYFRQLFDLEDYYRKSSDEERLAARQRKVAADRGRFHDWLQRERVASTAQSRSCRARSTTCSIAGIRLRDSLESGVVPMDK